MPQIVERFLLAVIASVFVTTPAWAGIIPAGVPGPVIGLGLPALVGMGMLYRRLRTRGGDPR